VNLNLDRQAWAQVRFDDVITNVVDRVDQPAAAGVDRYVGLEHLDPGSMTVNRWGSPSDVEATKLRFKPGDVIFGRRRAYQKKVARADFEGICSAHAMVLRAKPGLADPGFLPVFLSSDIFLSRAVQISVGSLSPTVNWKTLASQKFHVPPIREQKRIAELLWAVEVQRRADARILADLRSVLPLLATRAFALSTDRLRIGDLGQADSQVVQVGPFGGSLASRHFTPSGVVVLKINNLMADGKIEWDETVFVSEEYASTLSRYILRPGDVVVAAQATVGRVGLVEQGSPRALISQHLIRVRIDDSLLDPRLLHLLLRSKPVQQQVTAVKTKTTRDGLNTTDVAGFELPALSRAQQQQLIAELTALEDGQRKATVAMVAADRLAATLRAAVLAGAA
jgi:type I restriction enzyme, S subunit